jgi:hypothetical protein
MAPVLGHDRVLPGEPLDLLNKEIAKPARTPKGALGRVSYTASPRT